VLVFAVADDAANTDDYSDENDAAAALVVGTHFVNVRQACSSVKELIVFYNKITNQALRVNSGYQGWYA
jgi:hypothetical protein